MPNQSLTLGPASGRAAFFRGHPLALTISALLLGGVLNNSAAAQGFPASMNLSGLNGVTGFRLDGFGSHSRSGRSVSSAGDINGDGLDDLIIGAYNASSNDLESGSSYVVFGKRTPFTATLSLSSLNGANGFRIDGAAAYDHSGFSVSAAGDVNGDGIDDLIVGAYSASPHGGSSGASYVVFGRTTPFAATLVLSSLDGTNGFRLEGTAAGDQSGFAVSAAGDINGDGIDDLIIGAIFAAPNGSDAGSSYVVFGKSAPFAATLALASLNGTNGFRLDGVGSGDESGRTVSAAGDINGDGIDDLIIGADLADQNGNSNSGSSYVVFGKNSPFAATLALASLDGVNGFRLDGSASGDDFGCWVSAAGDTNGDGISDLIVGAPLANPNGADSGSSFAVFGRSTPFSATLALSDLNGTNGFRLDGAAAGDYSGLSVKSAGDIDGDGLDDLIVGALFADPNSNTSAGSSYVVFGRSAVALFRNGFE